MLDTINGRVTGRDGLYYRVECPNAALDHVKVLHLTPFQLAGASVGDAVELIYLAGPRSGAWVVSRVLREQ